jgi:hypothetical protein
MLAVPEREPASSRWATRAALFAFGLIVTTAFLHRLFGMDTPVAFNLVLVALVIALGSIASALLAALTIWSTGRPGTSRVLFAVFLSLGILTLPLFYQVWLRSFPMLSDITTDAGDPPPLTAAIRLRGPGNNSVKYNRAKWSEQQALAYPDIQAMTIPRSGEESYALVVDAVKRLNMELTREDPPDAEAGTPGVVEAVDKTLIMGFLDDVAIRVSGGEEQSRVDIRSASRFGRGDMGRNAERIRALMTEIRARVDATVPAAKDARQQGGKAAKPEKEGDPKRGARRR